MGLTAALVALFSESLGAVSAAKDVTDYLRDRVHVEDLLGRLVEERFAELRIRIDHLCRGSRAEFRKDEFIDRIRLGDIRMARAEDLVTSLVPVLRESVFTPGAETRASELDEIYGSILKSAVSRMWRELGGHPVVAQQIIAEQGRGILSQQQALAAQVTLASDSTSTELGELRNDVQELSEALTEFRQFASDIFRDLFDALLDKAPPVEHTIDAAVYKNPFLLVRAEDFNHNYDRLARLFHGSPDWASIQSRTDNVFIEGGRGTGKSMLLRRLTAQATVAARRINDPSVSFDDVGEEYFGVYVKLARGYYEQFSPRPGIPSHIVDLLAQHELNVEITDALVDALLWLEREKALPSAEEKWHEVAGSLSSLFSKAPPVRTLEEIAKKTIPYEQDQIVDFLRDRTFEREGDYRGSARDTVSFVKRLADVFRTSIFGAREVRLFILLDEFETLTAVQQTAVNTVMKMRLPDVTMKIAVRHGGRKTSETFTTNEPLQEPRDCVTVDLDYRVKDRDYVKFLEGVAQMRLKESGYPADVPLDTYLGYYNVDQEVSAEALERELEIMWNLGKRRTNTAMNAEFRRKYAWTAVYRIRNEKNKRKLFFGLDHFVLLSSGIVSSFMELCKYAFYFALEEGLPLRERPAIPIRLQTDAAYAVSQRSLGVIDANVPGVGAVLQRLVEDLGAILRVRLLKNISDPESNRLTLLDYGALDREDLGNVREVLDSGVVWSVLHLDAPRKAFRPRTRLRPRSAEIIINRVYSPALGFSPRSRWRAPMRLVDLAGLLNPSTREEAHRRLVKSLAASSADDGGTDDGQGDLLEE